MKRFILPLLLVATMICIVGVVGYLSVMFLVALANQPRPFTYQQLEDLQNQEKIGDDEIPRLLAGLERNDDDVRIKSAETLAQMGDRAIEPVREKLKSKNARVRFFAMQTFAFMEPEHAKTAVADLIAGIDDPDADVRRKAVYALGRVGGNVDGVLPALRRATSDRDLTVVQAAQEALVRAEKK